MRGALATSFTVVLSPVESFGGLLTGSHEVTQEEWLAPFTTTKSSHGGLYLFRFADPIYALLKPVKWTPDKGAPADLDPVEVPIGFVTDFASIPQIFWSVLPKDGKYTFAAILHDYLYWTQDRERAQCDEVLSTVMQEFGVGTTDRNAIYWAVRAGGGSAWDENAAAKAKGEKRILKRLPDNPQITWEKWKTEVGVF